jgi:hypothetical protein
MAGEQRSLVEGAGLGVAGVDEGHPVRGRDVEPAVELIIEAPRGRQFI